MHKYFALLLIATFQTTIFCAEENDFQQPPSQKDIYRKAKNLNRKANAATFAARKNSLYHNPTARRELFNNPNHNEKM